MLFGFFPRPIAVCSGGCRRCSEGMAAGLLAGDWESWLQICSEGVKRE